jgi:signal transduction histidine kinase
MSGQTSDFFSTHSGEILDAWRSEVGPGADTPHRTARAFINAILVALTADDLRPLAAYYDLETSKIAGIDERLNTAIHHMLALYRAVDSVAEQDGMAPNARLELVSSTVDELGHIKRRLVNSTMASLVEQLAASHNASSARGTSLSITMHELRRPLTILNSYSQLLSSGMLGVLPESASVAIEGISSSTEMMVRLVSALSELSRLEDPDDKLNPEELTLLEVVNAAVEPLETEAEFRDTVMEQEVEDEATMIGDKRRLVLALTNVLSNALKHSPPSGVVSIHAWKDDDGTHFRVRDQGPGFPPEDGIHLFDKYFRSTAERHRKIPGSGLGLYIVRTIAQRHGGDVIARSEPGKGAEFEIVIPKAGS